MRREFTKNWEPRVGKEAANQAWMGTRAIALAGLSTPVWGVLLAMGSLRGHQWEKVSGLCLLAGCLVCFFVGLIYLFRLPKSLSEHFGHRIALWQLPPFRDDGFEKWIQKFGNDA